MSKASLGDVLLFVVFLNHEVKLSYRQHKHMRKCQIRFMGNILKRNLATFKCINNLHSGKSRMNIGGKYQDILCQYRWEIAGHFVPFKMLLLEQVPSFLLVLGTAGLRHHHSRECVYSTFHMSLS